MELAAHAATSTFVMVDDAVGAIGDRSTLLQRLEAKIGVFAAAVAVEADIKAAEADEELSFNDETGAGDRAKVARSIGGREAARDMPVDVLAEPLLVEYCAAMLNL